MNLIKIMNLQAPVVYDYYSLDSNKTYFRWNNTNQLTYIFRGEDENNMLLVDSTNQSFYVDSVEVDKIYYYYLQYLSKDSTPLYSNKSEIFQIFSHAPTKVLEVNVLNSKSLEITFNHLINHKDLKISSFLN